LKPGNVLVGRDGRVRVVDFGVARTLSTDHLETGAPYHDTSLTRDGIAIGTLNYMSPEQLAARPIDARSDLFSLGVVLFEMATGELPFPGDSAALVASSILRDRPRRIDERATKLPPQIVDLIDSLLAKNPDERPGSAVEVRDRLRQMSRLFASETETATPARAALAPGPPAPRSDPGKAENEARRARRRALGVVALVLMVAVAGALYFRRPPPAPAPSPAAVSAIAVLPFRSFSGDPDYFVDGMTDGLIDSLAKVGGLRVISRQSAMHFKGSSKLLAEVARELGVDYLVEGTVARHGDRVQIRAKLLRPEPEEQLWTETYDRPLADFLVIEGEVATAIARRVKVTLSPEESARLAAVGGVDPEAHDAYLRGRYQVNERSAESLAKAIESFQEAIRIAPDFALAHAALADAYAILARVRGDDAELHRAAKA
ncbi:MAG: protein kinase domain-containing protein, partial [Myxococcota bacterium]